MLLRNCKKSPKICFYLSLFLIAALIILTNEKFIFSIVISLSFFLLILSIVFILSSRLIFSISLSSIFIIVLNFINQLKAHFYKNKLMFADLNIMFDPANTIILTHYPFTALALFALLGLIIINGVLSWRASLHTKRLIYHGCCVMVIIVSCLSINYIVKNFKSTWESSLPSGAGVITNLVMSASQFTYAAPVFDTSPDYFLSMSEHITPPHDNNRKKPDIIALLQESTMNPHFYSLPTRNNVPHLAMFDIDKNIKASGLMRVHTFGGRTWLSEFSFLTGLMSDDFGVQKSSVFYTVVNHLNSSLFKELKNNGYYTIALTPFNKSAYNSNYAYNKMGIDRIIHPQELGYPSNIHDNLWDIPSKDILNYVKMLLQQENNKPIFIFALTMNEHNPYDEKYEDKYNLTKFVKKPTVAGRFSHYMSKLISLDSAVQNFSEYVATREKSTIFLYFGDHQASIGWNNGYDFKINAPSLITQYYLKDNINKENINSVGEITDISFLGGMLLERANLSTSPFYQANIAMRHLCKGALNDCSDKKLVNSYKNYIYQKLKVASLIDE